MTILIDTSVWVDLLRDQTGSIASSVRTIVGDAEIALTRFNQLELLQGASDERDWALLSEYLEVQEYLEANASTWRNAARIYFELRRRGMTVRSLIDCCIAQIALEHRVMLLHKDHDFETIAKMRPLQHCRT